MPVDVASLFLCRVEDIEPEHLVAENGLPEALRFIQIERGRESQRGIELASREYAQDILRGMIFKGRRFLDILARCPRVGQRGNDKAVLQNLEVLEILRSFLNPDPNPGGAVDSKRDPRDVERSQKLFAKAEAIITVSHA